MRVKPIANHCRIIMRDSFVGRRQRKVDRDPRRDPGAPPPRGVTRPVRSGAPPSLGLDSGVVNACYGQHIKRKTKERPKTAERHKPRLILNLAPF